MGNSLGNNIKSLREKKKLSQAKLAQMLNVSPQAVSKWENDKSIPDLVTISTLATIFNTSIDALIKSGNIENKEILSRTNECIQNKNISKYVLAKYNSPLRNKSKKTLFPRGKGISAGLFLEVILNLYLHRCFLLILLLIIVIFIIAIIRYIAKFASTSS